MRRYVQQLVIAALFFSSARLWAMESPNPFAQLSQSEEAATTIPSAGKLSCSAWVGDVADGYDDEEFAPLPAADSADLLPSSDPSDTPIDGLVDSRSGDVTYQFGPAGECAPHPSAADLLRRAPKARSERRELAFRFGWWGTSRRGVPTKVGEFQDLSSSPFWDYDQLFSNGVQTIDLNMTGLDNEGNQAGFYFFGPRVSIGIDYQRYLRRLDHDPLTNMAPAGPAMNNIVLQAEPHTLHSELGDLVTPARIGEEIVSEDLNVGDDYAIRVQNLNTYVKGRLTKNVKYRVNFWMQRKKGDRQAIGTQHCAGSSEPGGGGSRECHLLSQTQRIDWLTTKIEPIIEARIGRLTVEYARPMRFFGQNDQVVTRSYGDFHVYHFGGDLPYAVVPENITQTDRIKVGLDLPLKSNFYARVHTGNTDNRNRNTNRRFYGYDLRLSNRYWDYWTLTGFARMNRQSNQFPPFFVDPEGQATSDTTVHGDPQFSGIVPQYGLRRPISYSRKSFGAEANWRPFRWTNLASGLGLNFGFERGHIGRQFAVYQIQDRAEFLDQNHTPYTSYFAGTSMKWAPTFDTFVRYKGRTTTRPLFGVNQFSGETNTNQPEQQNRIEIGGSWIPTDNLIATANLGLENRSNNSSIASFNEDNYPLTFSLWYAPTVRWSFSAGYSYLSNWIDQEIYFPSDTPGVEPYDRRTWSYGGTGQVVNVGGSYAWTPDLSLSGGIEFVSARNAISPLEPWPDLPQYFDVVVNRTRVTGGVDWTLGSGVSAYFRYVFDDYQDRSVSYNSGLAHMVLTGFSAIY